LRTNHRFDSANSVVSCAVFFFSPRTAHLHVTELALDDPKRMLDLGADAGLELLEPLLQLPEGPAQAHRLGCRLA